MIDKSIVRARLELGEQFSAPGDRECRRHTDRMQVTTTDTTTTATAVATTNVTTTNVTTTNVTTTNVTTSTVTTTVEEAEQQ